jgi:hypothetical protein
MNFPEATAAEHLGRPYALRSLPARSPLPGPKLTAPPLSSPDRELTRVIRVRGSRVHEHDRLRALCIHTAAQRPAHDPGGQFWHRHIDSACAEKPRRPWQWQPHSPPAAQAINLAQIRATAGCCPPARFSFYVLGACWGGNLTIYARMVVLSRRIARHRKNGTGDICKHTPDKKTELVTQQSILPPLLRALPPPHQGMVSMRYFCRPTNN